MKTLNIKKYTESYLYKLNCFMLENSTYIPNIYKLKDTLLLLNHETIIGIGSIWDNSIHPYRDYISISISKEDQNTGLGTLLFHELEKQYKLKRLQTHFDSNNIVAANFAIRNGFSLIRKCYSYTVTQNLLKPFNYNTISGEIISVADLSLNQLNSLIKLQHKNYIMTHEKINPLNCKLSIKEWEKIIYSDLTLKDSYVLIDNKNISSYLLCYKTDDNSVDLGYTGNSSLDITTYKSFLYKTISLLFKSYNHLNLEIDDCDMCATILGQLFDYKPHVSWDTYIKNNKQYT